MICRIYCPAGWCLLQAEDWARKRFGPDVNVFFCGPGGPVVHVWKW